MWKGVSSLTGSKRSVPAVCIVNQATFRNHRFAATISMDHALSPTSIIAATLCTFHDRCIGVGHANPFAPAGPLWHAIKRNHRYNMLLWDQEDRAERRDVPGSEIVENKCSIDRFSQERNDAIEAIDETVLTMFAVVERRPNAWQNSETRGSMVDRLSILSLKCHHAATPQKLEISVFERCQNCDQRALAPAAVNPPTCRGIGAGRG
jgi:hypothetical protein